MKNLIILLFILFTSIDAFSQYPVNRSGVSVIDGLNLPWKTNETYIVDELVFVNEKLYVNTVLHVSSPLFETDYANWTEISAGGLIPWVTAFQYNLGENVYDTLTNKIYRVTTAHLSGATFAGDIANFTELSNGIPFAGTSTDNAIPRWDGIAGDTLQDSNVIIDDTDNVSGIANLTATGTTTLNVGLTGVTKLTAGVVSVSDVDLATEVTGVLPIANGGSNSAAALVNNLVMISSGGAIIESSVTTTTLGYLDVTSSVQTLLNSKFTLAGESGGQIANGGTDASDNLTLNSTSNATKGEIYIDGIPLKQFTNNSASTGLHAGGSLSINTDTTKFDLTLGDGHIIDSATDPNNPVHTDVSWSAFTAQTVTNIATNDFTHIYITSAGAILQSVVAPTPQLRRDNIYLGKLIHNDNVNVNNTSDQPESSINIGNAIADYWKALGPIVLSGNRISANAGVNLSFDKSAGDMHQEGINYQTDKQQPNIKTISADILATFRYRTQTGVETGDITVIDPTVYDNAGTVTAIGGSNNQATNIRVYLFNSGNLRVQYGQQIYSTLANAVEGITTESFIKENNIEDNAVLISILSVEKGASDLSVSADAKFSAASKFGEISLGTGASAVSTLQDAYDNSITPEIVLDATRGGLTLQDNATPIGANLLEVQSNGGGSTFFNVTSAGMFTTEASIAGDLTVDTTSLFVDSTNNRVGVGTITPSVELDVVGDIASTGLTVTSTTQGASPCPSMTLAQRDAIGTPAEGDCVVNSDSKALNYYLNGAWGEIAGGGGSGGINYLADTKDSDFEVDVGNWVAFNDGAVDVPVDGTGGTAVIACTRNTTTPLRLTGDMKVLAAASDMQGEGCSADFDIDLGMRAQKLTGKFWLDTSDANYADDDMAVFIYDKTNTNIIRVNGEPIKGKKGEHYFQFQSASDSTSYRLIAMVTSTATLGYSIYFDQIAVGPTNLARGGILTQSMIANGGSRTTAGIVSNYTIQEQEGGSLLSNSSGTWTVLKNNTMVTASITGSSSAADSRATIRFKIGGTTYDASLDAQNVGGGYNMSASGSYVLNKDDTLTFETTGVGNISSIIVTFSAMSSEGVSSSDLGGREIVVEGAGNGGTAKTGSVDDIDFTETNDSIASWNGTQFTVPETGSYTVSGAVNATAGHTGGIRIFVDPLGVGSPAAVKYIGVSQASTAMKLMSGQIKLIKGDILSIRCDATITLSNSTSKHTIHIQKLASPQTVLETATVAARYTTSAGTGYTSGAATVVDFGTKVSDTHGAVTTGATWKFTAPMSGNYTVCMAGLWADNAGWDIGEVSYSGLRKNGGIYSYLAYDELVATVNPTSTYRAVKGCDDIDLVTNDYIDIRVYQNTGGTLGFISNSQYNYISIKRNK